MRLDVMIAVLLPEPKRLKAHRCAQLASVAAGFLDERARWPTLDML
jgi:hypothetical protein